MHSKGRTSLGSCECQCHLAVAGPLEQLKGFCFLHNKIEAF